MKALKFKFDLDNKVAVYVPSTIGVDKVCDTRKQVDETLTKLSGWFGGATATDAIGGWQSESGKLVKEHITIVYAFCTKVQFTEHIDELVEYCEKMRDELGQEAVALEYNGQIAFI